MRHLNLIAVDVSESSIKVLQLNDDKSIKAYGNAPLERGVVEKGHIIDVETFSAVLNQILKHTKPNILADENSIQRAFLCLPESKLYSHHCVIPDSIKREDIESYLYAEASKIIPFELTSLYSNHHVAEENGVRNATFIGVEKSFLDNYVKAFVHSNVRPAFIGGELFALGNALLPNPVVDEDCIILDIGVRSATIGMFSTDAVPNDSILFPFGGEYFTNYLAERLDITFDEAETLKRLNGVNPAYEETGVPIILRQCLSVVTDKLNEAKMYFEAKTGSPVKHIIIAGGSALLPHIDTFITEKTGIQSTVANPLFKINGHDLLVKDETPNVLFANVVGLALAASNSDFAHINLLTQYDKDEEVTNNESLALTDIRSVTDAAHVLIAFWRKIKTDYNFVLQYVKKVGSTIKQKLSIILSVIVFIAAGLFLFWVLKTYL
jgi:type IV pilus assembly protein PilM